MFDTCDKSTLPSEVLSKDTDLVYTVLGQHQATESWQYQEIITELQRWKKILDLEFKLELPPIAFRFGGAKSNCYAHFRPGHNDFGIQREVAFHEGYLLERINAGETWKIYGTLLHECLHAWQYQWGTPSTRNHHNTELREKALSLGLIMGYGGVTTYATESPFMDLLKKHGMQIPIALPKTISAPKTHKLKKWSCACKPPVNVRVGRSEFHALCLICNTPFKLQKSEV